VRVTRAAQALVATRRAEASPALARRVERSLRDRAVWRTPQAQRARRLKAVALLTAGCGSSRCAHRWWRWWRRWYGLARSVRENHVRPAAAGVGDVEEHVKIPIA
jgi:hypothetical protein